MCANSTDTIRVQELKGILHREGIKSISRSNECSSNKTSGENLCVGIRYQYSYPLFCVQDAQQAVQFVEKVTGEGETCFINNIVLCEPWVLEFTYRYTKEEVADLWQNS